MDERLPNKRMWVKIHHEPITIKEDNKTIFIGHGDGLGPGEKSFKIIKKIFKNRICQWLFKNTPKHKLLTMPISGQKIAEKK